jgi:hypothetical protein
VRQLVEQAVAVVEIAHGPEQHFGPDDFGQRLAAEVFRGG